MGFLKDLVKNPVKAVTKEFNNARESFERSDIGKTASTIVRPATASFEATGDVLKGDFNKAGKRLGGAVLQSFNPLGTASSASTSFSKLLKSNKFTDSWAYGGEAIQKLQRGESLTAQESNQLGMMYAKEAAIAGTVVGSSSILTWAGDNPVTAGVLGSQLYKSSKTGDYSSFIKNSLNELSPGLGNLVPGSSNGYTDVTPSEGNAYSNYSVSGTDQKTKYAIIAAGIILFLLLIKKMRS